MTTLTLLKKQNPAGIPRGVGRKIGGARNDQSITKPNQEPDRNETPTHPRKNIAGERTREPIPNIGSFNASNFITQLLTSSKTAAMVVPDTETVDMGEGIDTSITNATATPLLRDETDLEYFSDFVLGIAFLVIGIIAAKR